MLTVFHGDNVQASRNALITLKASFAGKELRELDGKSLDETNLTQALESKSLFGSETAVIIENLFSKITKQSKKIEALAKIMVKSAESTDIVLWENRQLPVSVLKSLGQKVNVKAFTFPKLLFQFLDSLRPNDSRRLIKLYQGLTPTEIPELLFTMIVKRVRQLIMVKDKVTPPGLQGWQITKLTNQAKLFTMNELLSMHQALLGIDSSIKTGASPYNLKAALELFILDI